jgi:hypothetical protein
MPVRWFLICGSSVSQQFDSIPAGFISGLQDDTYVASFVIAYEQEFQAFIATFGQQVEFEEGPPIFPETEFEQESLAFFT